MLYFTFLDGVYIECNISNDLIVTKYHPIDYDRYIDRGSSLPRRQLPPNKVIYANEKLLRSIIEKANASNCYQSIDLVCHPLGELLMTLDVGASEQRNRICSCKR